MQSSEYRLRLKELKDQKRNLVATIIITVGCAVIGSFATIYTVNNQIRATIYTVNNQIKASNQLEYSREIWKIKFETYNELGRVISTIISNRGDRSLLIEENDKFQRLYWSTTTLLEDSSITELLYPIKLNIKQIIDGDSVSIDELRIKSYDLLRVCQQSLKKTWE